MNQPPGNTPRTDAAVQRVERDFADQLKAMANFSRHLERELNMEKAKNLAVEAFRTALDAIISDPEADAVQIAHQAITPYTEWRRVSKEEAARIDASVLGNG